MRRSKLESYEDILEALIRRPLTIDDIAYETNMDCSVLRRYLDSLVKNGLVEKRALGKKSVHAITERGMAVFKTLNFQKYLERVTNAIRAMDEAMHIIPIISEGSDKKEKEKEIRENGNY